MHSPGVIFTRPERCLPSEKNISAVIHKVCEKSKVWNHMCLVRYLIITDAQLSISCWAFSVVLVHLPDAFLGSQTNLTVLSPILSSIYDTPWKYFYISEFAYIPRIETLEKNQFVAGGRLTFFRSEWKITLPDLKPKDNYNVGTLNFKTVPDESWMNKWIEWPYFS